MPSGEVVFGALGVGAVAAMWNAGANVVAAAQGADVNALDVIGTGSQLTVVGVLVLIAHRFATGQLVSRDVAAALARMDKLAEKSLEREEELAGLKRSARDREDRLWRYVTGGTGSQPDPPGPHHPPTRDQL